MRRSPGTLCIAALLLAPGRGGAQGLSIDHRAVGCVVAERYPRIEARFDPGEALLRARVYFRGKGTSYWYFVDMSREGEAFSGVLPKPMKSLGSIEYYLEALDRALVPTRTPDYESSVVSAAVECRKDGPAAVALSVAKPVVGAAPGAPALPPGFSPAGVVTGSSSASGTAASAGSSAGTAGLGSGAIAGIVAGGAAAVAGGVVLATHKGSSGGSPTSGSSGGNGSSGGFSPGGTWNYTVTASVPLSNGSCPAATSGATTVTSAGALSISFAGLSCGGCSMSGVVNAVLASGNITGTTTVSVAGSGCTNVPPTPSPYPMGGSCPSVSSCSLNVPQTNPFGLVVGLTR